MLFDIRQFEHFFREPVLKRGLKIFERGELEFTGRIANFEFRFVSGHVELLLKKNGDNLISYICTCSDKSYCRHLSAAMFYFQQEALGITVKTTGKKRKSDLEINQTLEANLAKVEDESLIEFVSVHQNNLSESKINAFLFDKKTLGFSNVYAAQLEYIINPYILLKKLDEEKINALQKEIITLIREMTKGGRKKEGLYYLYLGIVKAFLPLFNIRYGGDEKTLFFLYYKALEKLNDAFIRGLDSKEKIDWFRTTQAALASNKHLHGEAFMFLIPRFVSFSDNKSELSLLSALLKKRIFKVPYSHQFDKLLIARMEVALTEWRLFGVNFPFQEGEAPVELTIAHAELDFCNNKIEKAFLSLEAGYEKIKKSLKNYLNDYLEYIIVKARKYKKTGIELKYLREDFIHRLFILPEALDRYIELIPPHEHLKKVESLVEQIKLNSRGYSFDKISLLYLKVNLLDKLIQELSVQNNKFSLIHEIALKKFPAYDKNFLNLYMRHLTETLRQDSTYTHKVKVFDTAKIFLNKLPEKTVTELIKALLDQIGKTGHLYRYINEMYDYPFLREEGEDY